MKKKEIDKAVETIQKGKGIPVNISFAGEDEQKAWLEKYIKNVLDPMLDIPLGVIDTGKCFKCTVCSKVVGESGFYCKWCGTQLREVTY